MNTLVVIAAFVLFVLPRALRQWVALASEALRVLEQWRDMRRDS